MSVGDSLNPGKYLVEIDYKVALENKATPYYTERFSTSVTLKESVPRGDFIRYMTVRARDLPIRKAEWKLNDVVVGRIVPEINLEIPSFTSQDTK